MALSAVHLDQDTLDRHIPRIWVERENRIPDIHHKVFLVHTPPGIHSIRDAPTTVPITDKLPSNLRHEINYIVAQLFCLIRLYTRLKLEVGRGGIWLLRCSPQPSLWREKYFSFLFPFVEILDQRIWIRSVLPSDRWSCSRDMNTYSRFRMLRNCSAGIYNSFFLSLTVKPRSTKFTS